MPDGTIQTTGTGQGASDQKLDLRQVLSDLISSAVNLRVATIVGDVTVSGAIQDMTVTVPTVAKSIVTNIDLVRGDITTVVSPDLLDAAHQSLVERHYAAVDAAQKNVKDNVAAFFSLIGNLRDSLLPAPTARAPKTIQVQEPAQPQSQPQLQAQVG